MRISIEVRADKKLVVIFSVSREDTKYTFTKVVSTLNYYRLKQLEIAAIEAINRLIEEDNTMKVEVEKQ